MRPRYLSIIQRFTVVICCLTVAACASFPGKQLPIYTYEQIVPHDPKPSIDYDTQYIRSGNELFPISKEQILQEEIPEVFNKSKLFSKITEGRGSEQYHIFLMLRDDSSALSYASGFISGLTLTIIPGYAKDKFILTVDVKEGNKLLKQYQYKDYTNDWVQLFLIFITPMHWPGDTTKMVIDNMLLNFLHDLQKDKILEVLPNSH